MTFNESMEKIESHEFAAILNVASDFKTFMLVAQQQDATKTLLLELDSPEIRKQVLSRVMELSRRRVDLRYENQWDTPLAIYVWLISLIDSNLARIAAEAVVQAPRCWWALKIAQNILFEQRIHSNASLKSYDYNMALIPEVRILSQISVSGEVILTAGFAFEEYENLGVNNHGHLESKDIVDETYLSMSFDKPPDYGVSFENKKSKIAYA